MSLGPYQNAVGDSNYMDKNTEQSAFRRLYVFNREHVLNLPNTEQIRILRNGWQTHLLSDRPTAGLVKL